MMRLLSVSILLCWTHWAQATSLSIEVVDNEGRPVSEAVAVAVSVATDPQGVSLAPTPTTPTTPTTPEAPITLDQIAKQFVPGLLVVPVGARVSFPNRDQTRHQVYSVSAAKPFELPLYGGGDIPFVIFDKPGPVALGCNIHDWMRAYVYVADSPWFAQTDATGHAVITLPVGHYTVQLWHSRLAVGADVTPIEVVVSADTLAVAHWQVSLKPPFAPHRAPVGGGRGY